MDAHAALGSPTAAETVFDVQEKRMDDLGLDGADETTRLVLERIREARAVSP